jgi:hypothetical protein
MPQPDNRNDRFCHHFLVSLALGLRAASPPTPGPQIQITYALTG